MVQSFASFCKVNWTCSSTLVFKASYSSSSYLSLWKSESGFLFAAVSSCLYWVIVPSQSCCLRAELFSLFLIKILVTAFGDLHHLPKKHKGTILIFKLTLGNGELDQLVQHFVRHGHCVAIHIRSYCSRSFFHRVANKFFHVERLQCGQYTVSKVLVNRTFLFVSVREITHYQDIRFHIVVIALKWEFLILGHFLLAHLLHFEVLLLQI